MNKLNGLKWKPFWNSQLGCLKGCTEYLGLEMSDAWFFGGTGVAFILHMDEEGFGAGGPWHNGPMMNLCNNLGFTVNGVYGFKSDDDFPVKQKMAWENTQNAIDRGLPCYGYNLGIPEYYVVYGYQDDGYLFSGIGVDRLKDRNEDRVFILSSELHKQLSVYGHETYVALDDPELCEMLNNLAQTKGYTLQGKMRMVFNGGIREIISMDGDSIILQGDGFTPWAKLGTVHVGMLEMYWVEPGQLSRDEEIVKEALEFALEFSKSPKKWVMQPYKAGIEAYDMWINALQSDQPNVFALSYNSQCWAECRRLATSFLRESADRIGGQSSYLLRDAANTYEEIYQRIQAVADLLPFDGKFPNQEMNSSIFHDAANHIKHARLAEQNGFNQLAAIVSSLS